MTGRSPRLLRLGRRSCACKVFPCKIRFNGGLFARIFPRKLEGFSCGRLSWPLDGAHRRRVSILALPRVYPWQSLRVRSQRSAHLCFCILLVELAQSRAAEALPKQNMILRTYCPRFLLTQDTRLRGHSHQDAVIVHLTHTDVPRMHRRFNHTQDNHIHLEVRRDLTHAYRRIDTDLVFRPVMSSKYCWPLPAKHLMSNVCTALSRHCLLDSAVVA